MMTQSNNIFKPITDNLQGKDEIKDFGNKYKNLTSRSWLLKDLILTSIIPISSKKNSDKKQDDLVIEITEENNEKEPKKSIRTGNFIGKFYLPDGKNEIEIEIKSRFNDALLTRMLNVANNVFLQDIHFQAKPSDKKSNIVKYIIGYLFIQSLEKASLLGFPKSYQTKHYHESKVYGNIDFNRHIKYDYPFNGKISSTTREQHYIPEIINVIYKAIQSIKDIFNEDIFLRINKIYSLTKQLYNGKYVDDRMIDKAIKDKALLNPIYSDFKKVLEYAKILIKLEDSKSGKSKQDHSGYLIDVSELWETYLYKLLQHHLPDCNVREQFEINTYKDRFYERHIIPDIVIEKDGHYAVFDAKYKRMKMNGKSKNDIGDLDREDFFQIHTYMTYFNKENNLIAGGLLYPFESNFDEFNCYSDPWIGGKAKFIVDGIDLSSFASDNSEGQGGDGDKLSEEENNFIKRILKVL